MRSSLFFAALLIVIAIGALVVVRNPLAPAAPASRGTVTLVGDSLNVGIEPYVSDALRGWKMVANDQVGRITPQGITELEAGRPVLSNYVVVSLGTNDPPSEVAAFRRDVARVLALVGPNRCVVWATIWRDERPNDAFNDVLRDAAKANRRVTLVEWAEMVEQNPDLLAPDRLHGNEDGYRERARMGAAAVMGCAPAQSVTPG
ncbi:MAG: GDSL-type esterase/lipase family protein [Thermoleophilia bacterium]|nr:GDSL-type esterase/lipase family protein [Thermoleophilia bacterium]